jgi:predicted Rossmann fold flavoprotein
MNKKVIVVGGGAAGLIAAGKAAEGAETILLEKMNRPGKKLSITGKGRCNLTNIAPLSDFITHFGKNGRFLRHAFSLFFASELLSFFEEIGIDCVIERGGRVFPKSGQARHIVDALVQWAVKQGVSIETLSPVGHLLLENSAASGVQLSDKSIKNMDVPAGKVYKADAVILATGGLSYPATGSTGDGYRLVKAVGHTIIPLRPALVPLETAGDKAKGLQGLSLKNVKAKMLVNGKKKAEDFGEMLFTHFGCSGPIILTLSRHLVDALDAGEKPFLSIDLKPALDDKKLDVRLLRDFDTHGKMLFQNLLKGLLPAKLIPVCIDETGIPAGRSGNQITSEERKRLRMWLKDFRFEVTGHRSFKEAVITAGGVDLKEVDPKTMESRKMKNLYFAGEVLDIDADTGGYNLQAAFSTGWLAGLSATGI